MKLFLYYVMIKFLSSNIFTVRSRKLHIAKSPGWRCSFLRYLLAPRNHSYTVQCNTRFVNESHGLQRVINMLKVVFTNIFKCEQKYLLVCKTQAEAESGD